MRAKFKRIRASTACLLAGAALVGAAAAQYGWMAVRQADLRAQLQGAASAPAPPPASAAVNLPMRLRIPRLNLDDAVVAGDSYRDLLVAPGWLPASAPPGATGNTVIAGHRDTFFRRLTELAAGDAIEIERGGRVFRYVVWRTLIVKPDQTGPLAPTPDARLTLVTCYPPHWVGPAPRRLVVQARRLDAGAH